MATPPKLDGINVIDGTNNAFTVTVGAGAPVAASITAGDYFIHQHTAGGDTSQLIERIQTAINGVAGASVTVTVSDSDGRVTIQNNAAATVRIIFTGTMGALLGFASNDTGVIAIAGSYVGARGHARGWYPNRHYTDMLGDASLGVLEEGDSAVTVSPSGVVNTTSFDEPRALAAYKFEALRREHVLPLPSINSVIVSYRDFWVAILKPGERFRWYDTRNVRSVAPFVYVAQAKTARDGTKALKRTVNWDRLYDLELFLHAFVS